MKPTDLILPEKLYVGIKGREPLNKETFPLGFCTPYETNKQFDSRKKTIDNWIGNPFDYKTKTYKFKDKYEGHILDNIPTEGFTLDKVVSRWSTSNKYYRINDPRGFQLEISTENLADILLNYSCTKGVLEGYYVWARHNSKVYLLHSRSDLYNSIINRDTNRELKIGDKINVKNDGNLIYIGKYYVINFGTKTVYSRDNGVTWGNRYGYGYYVQDKKLTFLNKDKTPWHVFYDGLDYKNKHSYTLKRKLPKYDLIEENCEYTDIINGQKIYEYGGPEGATILFKTLDAMKSYDVSNFDIIKEYQTLLDEKYK